MSDVGNGQVQNKRPLFLSTVFATKCIQLIQKVAVKLKEKEKLTAIRIKIENNMESVIQIQSENHSLDRIC